MAVKKIATFDDWIDAFRAWQKDIGLRLPRYADYAFEAKYGDLKTEEIEFGDFRGERKWERITQIPHQPIRDALLNLIVYQGDTEFASVEQQRNLLETSPSDYDTDSVCRIMTEEMRHGWQMCHLLVNEFGETGKIEARKLLERRSWQNNRLLGSFNVDVDNWVDFFTYTEFVDRDGKFQLQMLKYSGFAPLGRSMSYMLREEAFHMGTGDSGLRRVVEAGVVPAWLIQKYLNKWISESYDLFGTDHSSSAHWAYVWGIKGRYNEPKNQQQPDLDDMNDYNRKLYHDEVAGLVAHFNNALKAGEPRLYAPDVRFNRTIGRWAGNKHHPQSGEPIEDKVYDQQVSAWLPTAADKKLLKETLATEKKWITPRTGARDPFETIAEPRKAAINVP